MAEIKINQKKELAQMLYVQGMTVQKHLATKVGVTEKTIGKWISDGGWEKLRKNIPLVKQEQLQNLLGELEQLNAHIKTKPEGKQFADSKEADARRKLLMDIQALEGEASISDTIHVAMNFSKWVSKTDMQLSQQVSTLFDGFIKEQLR